MNGSDIPDRDNAVRYAAPSHIDGGEILGGAFCLRTDEAGLSINWLECFAGMPKAAQLDEVRRLSRLRMRRSGRLAELNVGAEKAHLYVETSVADTEAVGANVAEAGNGHRCQRDGAPAQDFAAMILENLRTAGVQQAHNNDKIDFCSLVGWPGGYICAEGRFIEGGGIDDVRMTTTRMMPASRAAPPSLWARSSAPYSQPT